MRFRHYAQGKFYLIECPAGSRVATSRDRLVVTHDGQDLKIPADPPELIPLLAESGLFGLMMIGEPEPDLRLAGVSCPACGERDATWLRPDDSGDRVLCERCGHEFAAQPVQIGSV